jgi:hypothetical protein
MYKEQTIPEVILMADKSYNGWKNRETWNVALWLNNEQGYYRMQQAFRDHYKKTRSSKADYQAFLEFAGLEGEKTPDGISFSNMKIDTRAIVNDVLFS